MSRAEAEAVIKSMEQELVVQRVRRQNEDSHPGNGRWLALIGVLFLVLAIFLYGVWKTNQAREEARQNPAGKPSPTLTPPKK